MNSIASQDKLNEGVSNTLAPHVSNVAHTAHHNFPAFDSTYFLSHAFWLLVSFGLFYLFVSKVIVPMVGVVLEMRHAKIASDLDNASILRNEANAILEESNKITQESNVKFNELVKQAKSEAKSEALRIITENEVRLSAKIEEASKAIEYIKSEAMLSIGNIVQEVTPILVNKFAEDKIPLAQINESVAKAISGDMS